MLVQWCKCSWFILSMLPTQLGESRTLLQVFKFNICKKKYKHARNCTWIDRVLHFCPFQNTGRYSISAESKETIWSTLLQLEKVQNYLCCVIANGLFGNYGENPNMYVTAWGIPLKTLCWFCPLSCWKICSWWGGKFYVSEISSRKNSCNGLCSLHVFDNNSQTNDQWIVNSELWLHLWCYHASWVVGQEHQLVSRLEIWMWDFYNMKQAR